jgi:O-antigen/teichoic acid export membrane protein
MFSRMLRLKEDVNGLIRIALPLLMVAGLTLAIAGNFYKQEIIGLLYKAHTGYSSRIFGVLIIGFIFVSTSYIFGTLLTANNNLRQLNWLAASTVFINVILNLILIPRHQALGAAISSLISQGYYAIFQLLLSVRLIRIPLNADILMRLAGFIVLNIAAGFLTLLIPGWIAGLLILLAVCFASALLLDLIKPSEIRVILQEK